ncbi:RND superfamily putative drug exporter [Kribbella steppae]|uniref:RND superfamily putative drug exporter n=1 Tax=Kribbella steppae TaxID=2512223 RepID=A0A4R2GZH9_9ACTN|nr:MMPL family transporter [Kribbella steppae]TCO17206.1 RND superfamily putative drug exporter [Kribbella steppae]
MVAALGKLVVRARWWVIAAWIVAAVVIAMTAPALQSTQDQSEFLPAHYESVKALTVQQEAFPERGEIGAIVVFDREDGSELTKDDQAKVSAIAEQLNTKGYDNLGTAAAAPASDNGLVQAIFVQVKPGKNAFDPAAIEDARSLRADLQPLVQGSGLRSGVTGPAAQSLDSQESSEQALVVVSVVTLLLIVVLLALIFRSVIACALPIVTVALVGTTATGLIAVANEAFDLKADSSISVILFIVLFGIGTDYILFFLFRYREALRLGFDGRGAVSHAVERAGEAIASAGGAVIIAFMAMVLSSLSIFRSIGPALAIAVALAVLAALTLVPAVVAVLGPRVISWPSKKWMVEPEATRFRAIGRSVAARPVRYAVISAGSLAVLSLFALGFNPTFSFSDSSTEQTESGQALITFQKGQPSGAADPTTVLLRSTGDQPLDDAELKTYAAELGTADGVASAALTASTDDVAVFTVVLSDDPTSDAAMANVEGPVRDTAHSAAPDGTEAFVGGTTSIFVDLDDAMARDYSVVFPVAAVLIMIILALLLRSLVAPFYLILSVGLGFTASLGATVLVFQGLLGQQGLIFILPIYIYLFVVALGTDYNILMVARLREEARGGLEPRPAAAKAIEHAGPTVAAAGLILAGTFASLMFAEGTFFKSLGFSFSVGIAMAAFVMALFLTPALTALIGHAAWWPGHGDRATDTVEEPAEGRVLES